VEDYMREKDNNKFFEEWKVNHDKGRNVYLAKNVLPFAITIILTSIVLVLVKAPAKAINSSLTFLLFLVIVIANAIITLVTWNNSEKRYKEIIEKQRELPKGYSKKK
jgi:heme/copper-type cytochrome/quinol oxidase subunit 4